jgi:tripartite ATP-independent transporter DctP family solute receptor
MNRIEDEIFWPVLAPAAEARGYRILAVWENGFRQITNNVRPIRVPADLAGIKLRTPRGDWRVRLFQAFGANPTPMPLSEVFVALQTGVIDGQENPLAQIDTNKFQEVQAYLSMTNHVYTPTYLAAGVERWERLPADVRAAIEDTARGMEEFIAAEAARMDREILEAFRAAGLRINQADRDSFLDASRPIYAEFASEVPGGEDMIATAIRLANP